MGSNSSSRTGDPGSIQNRDSQSMSDSYSEDQESSGGTGAGISSGTGTSGTGTRNSSSSIEMDGHGHGRSRHGQQPSGSENESSTDTPDDLIQVFRVLISAGEISVMSSDDESEDPDYQEVSRVKARAPKERYIPETSELDKNDLALKLGNSGSRMGQFSSIPKFLQAQQLGITNCPTWSGTTSNFDRQTRQTITSSFLPNSFRTIANYGYKAFCGSYSKAGDIFLSASQDRTIRIYDTSGDNFKESKRILARDVGWSVLDTAFSPDGRHVAYSSWSESIHICNIMESLDKHDALPLYPDTRRFCIFSIAFSEDGTEILGGANDGYLYVFNREANLRVLKIGAHEDDVNSVAFADETSNILFSASDDGLVKVWDRRSMNESDPKPVGILAGHIDGITYVEPKHDGRYLLTNSKDQSMKLWDMRKFSAENGMCNARKFLEEHTWDYRWQRVPKKLCVSRRAVEGDTSIMTYRGHSVLNTLIRCHFSPSYSTGQKYVYSGCAAGRVVIYDLLTGKTAKILEGHNGCVRDVSWHPFKPNIVSASWDNSVGIWTYEGSHGIDSDTELMPEINTTSAPERPATALGLGNALEVLRRRLALHGRSDRHTRRRHPAGTGSNNATNNNQESFDSSNMDTFLE